MSDLTGLWIPIEYLRNNLLTGNERLIISYIKFRETDNQFSGTNREIVRALDIKDNRVSEAIVELIKKGFLERNDKTLKVSENWKHSDFPKNGNTISENRKHSEKRKQTEVPKSGNIVSEKRILPEIIPYSNNKKENNSITNAKNQSEEKEQITKKVATKRKLSIVTFLESEMADFKVFEEFIQTIHPDLDTNYYYHKVSTWLDKSTGEPPKRMVWKNTIKVFIENDYKRGELVTKSKSHGNKSNSQHPQQTNIFDQQTDSEDLDSLTNLYFTKRGWT